MKRKAIALFSGGLDSTLAILLVQKQNIDVLAITFLTDFGCDIGDSSSCSKNPGPAADKFGFDLKLCHLGQKFVDREEATTRPRQEHEPMHRLPHSDAPGSRRLDGDGRR